METDSKFLGIFFPNFRLYQPLYNKTFFANDVWNKSYMNCGNEMKMKKWSSQKPEKKIQDFNGVWTRDLAITGAMLYQLSHEATDVGSRSIDFFTDTAAILH